MAAAQKKARLTGASLVCLDESGFRLTPVVRRTLAPRGHTPVLRAWDRRDRLSAISAVTLSPRRRRPGLYFAVRPTHVRSPEVVAFLHDLQRHLRRPLVVVWDRAKIHDRAAVVRRYLAAHRTIETVALPPSAPDLNPDERVGGYVTYGRLATYAAPDLVALRRAVTAELHRARRQPALLTAFFEHATHPQYDARLFHLQGWSH